MGIINHLAPPAVAAGAGAGAGAAVVSYTGMTAAGMVGGGAGFGTAAGPVGMVIGGLTGLAIYGVCRALGDVVAEQVAVIEYTIDENDEEQN